MYYSCFFNNLDAQLRLNGVGRVIPVEWRPETHRLGGAVWGLNRFCFQTSLVLVLGEGLEKVLPVGSESQDAWGRDGG